ncbi:MAG: glycosyltransferase [Thermoflavifilum sp.]|nr:glycosyltransferase [Thermoflavifilum sp.]
MSSHSISEFAPIALFVFNRPELTLQTLQHLAKNAEARYSILYVFADGPKANFTTTQMARFQQVRNIIQDPVWAHQFKEVHIIASETNKGLASSIIAGVTEVINKHGRIIVLEDDLKVSPYFLQYMNEALTLYASEEKVLAVHGYVYPVYRLGLDKNLFPQASSYSSFFIRDPGCWGWGTWKRAWQLFDHDAEKLYHQILQQGLKREFNFWGGYPYTRLLRLQIAGKIDSWAVCWRAVAYLHQMLTLHPAISLVSHEGNVPDATHTYFEEQDPYQTEVSDRPIHIEKIPIENNERVERLFGEYLRKYSGMSISSKIKRRLKRLFR